MADGLEDLLSGLAEAFRSQTPGIIPIGRALMRLAAPPAGTPPATGLQGPFTGRAIAPVAAGTPVEREAELPQVAMALSMLLGSGPGQARIGVLPERIPMAMRSVREGMPEAWFHGAQHPEKILSEGFSPAKIGTDIPLWDYEPAGVSLTKDPHYARAWSLGGQASGQVLRVGVDIPPEQIGRFSDPAFRKLFIKLADFHGPQRGFEMARDLQERGYAGMLYGRMGGAEEELRAFDLSRLHPLGLLDTNTKDALIRRLRRRQLRVPGYEDETRDWPMPMSSTGLSGWMGNLPPDIRMGAR
jgi:hypothetical protein